MLKAYRLKLYFVLPSYYWVWGLPCIMVGITNGTPLEKYCFPLFQHVSTADSSLVSSGTLYPLLLRAELSSGVNLCISCAYYSDLWEFIHASALWVCFFHLPRLDLTIILPPLLQRSMSSEGRDLIYTHHLRLKVSKSITLHIVSCDSLC